MRAAVGLVVAIDAGDDGIAQTHSRDSFGDAERLFFIGRTGRSSAGHGAKSAGARADISQNHEGGGAVVPAFAHVGAAGAFANGVEIERAHDALEILVTLAAEEFYAEPIGARMRARQGNRDGRLIRDDVER